MSTAALSSLSPTELAELVKAYKFDGGLESIIEKAARWDALMSSGRLHFMGCAGFNIQRREPTGPKTFANSVATPQDGAPMHFGMEFWSTYNTFPKGEDQFERDFMITYVDELRRRAK
jgi:hypothetical protein